MQYRSGTRALLRHARRLLPGGYGAVGLAFAVLFVCLSLTPSLLPRGPAFQGWLSGIVAAAGYGIGCLLRALVIVAARRVTGWRPPARWTVVGRVALGLGGPAVIGLFLVAARDWQRETHRLVGEPPPGPGSPVLLVSLMVLAFVVLVTAGRLLRRATRFVARRLAVWLPVLVAGAGAAVLVAVAAGTVFDQVVLRIGLTWTDRVARATNDETPDGVLRPAGPLRSGSPASLVAWHDLGYEGRIFVAGGPTDAQLDRFVGPARTALSPIRAYVGLLSADDAQQRADLALAELQRTGAFDRAVICVVTTTGTGWVDARAATALEYLYGGDTAIVATQYSYLPSAVAFLFDDDMAELEGRTLFARIHAYWSTLPAGHRPKLVVYGESLGSNGGQAAFATVDQMRHSVDGALFVGPPSSNGLWAGLVRRRDPGSPERLPVYQGGAAIRFAADEASLGRAQPRAWQHPRVLFLQHSTDPAVWWSSDLLFRRPGWLEEERGPGVSPSMSWYPIVTFWQVSADLVEANHVPSGAGHRYGDLTADGWAAVIPPAGWTAADTLRLKAAVP